MSKHVFVVSEWIAKENHEEELLDCFKKLLAKTMEQEEGCVKARVTQQITHPGAPTQSEYTIVLLQEYVSLEAFDHHCKSAYVADFFKTYIEDKKTSIVKDWRCRLFSEAAS